MPSTACYAAQCHVGSPARWYSKDQERKDAPCRFGRDVADPARAHADVETFGVGVRRDAETRYSHDSKPVDQMSKQEGADTRADTPRMHPHVLELPAPASPGEGVEGYRP